MQICFSVLLFLLGFLFTIRGGDSFILAATRISEIFGIPKFIVGATVVSLATTLPELIVSLLAAADGKTEMAVGNAVGSVTANTGLILALSIIFIPSAISRKKSGFKCILLLLCVPTLFICSLSGRLTIIGSALLLFLFCAFIAENVYTAKGSPSPPTYQDSGDSLSVSVLRFTFGASAIIIGAKLLVDNGSLLALRMGISEAVISTTVLAVGTSLPELTTTISAIKRKESALSLGNVLGANIIDLSIILPLCSLVSGQELPISRAVIKLDMPACLIITCISMLPPLLRGKFSRRQGILMLAAYIFYIAITIISA